MEAIGITELRKNIKSTLDKVVDNGTQIIVHRPNQEDVVMVALNDYNSLVETLELLSLKTNRERLYLGMEQVNEGKPRKYPWMNFIFEFSDTAMEDYNYWKKSIIKM